MTFCVVQKNIHTSHNVWIGTVNVRVRVVTEHVLIKPDEETRDDSDSRERESESERVRETTSKIHKATLGGRRTRHR